MIKPRILSPAGSFEALEAAINAGADEVYFGLPEFNARYNAKNFSPEELKEALKMCSLLGVKSNITVNTLVTDRELVRVLDMVYSAASLGADAFIVQDLGLASQIKRQMPSVCIHASTQCACHNAEGAAFLSQLGFSRVVLAREMPGSEIQKVVESGIETEIFVHGALCVCHSGMCLMSSVIGQRSGNRGLCAQPCRLPYKMAENKNSFPLSLRDLSLAGDVKDIVNMGITSLKIEGRMKSPEYVYGTTRIWKSLVDSGSDATKEQLQALEDIFSRGGFTDRYFTGKYTVNNRDMYGIRSDEDKKSSRQSEEETRIFYNARKRKIKISCSVKEAEPVTARAFCEGAEAYVTSDFVSPAATGKPLSCDEIKQSMSKLGNTLFETDTDNVEVSLCGNVFLSKAMLNSVRRALIEELEKKLYCPLPPERFEGEKKGTQKRNAADKTEKIYNCVSIAAAKRVKDAQYLCIPLSEIENADEGLISSCAHFGVTLPRVVYSSEMKECRRLLGVAAEKGAEFALVSNIGQIEAVKKSGLFLFGNIGLNVFNSETIRTLESMGFSLITVSPELNEAQVRDLEKKNSTRLCAFAKGKLPLMVLESCIVRAGGVCKKQNEKPCTLLHDRIGKTFEVYGEKRLSPEPYPCRNIIYNSVETDLLSKNEKLSKMNVDTAMIMLLE